MRSRETSVPAATIDPHMASGTVHDYGACSWTALATSQAFTDALRRDVHILVHAFALTWEWLDGKDMQNPAPAVSPLRKSLRYEYGALTVFERVWTRNQWKNASDVLGSDLATRRAFSDMVIRAFLDELAPVSPPTLSTTTTTTLNAVAATFALACWWHAQPPGTHDALYVDMHAYRALLELPERARLVLDDMLTHSVVPDTPPPSADVYYTVQELVSSVPLRVTVTPTTVPRLRASTMLLPKKTTTVSERQSAADMRMPLASASSPADEISQSIIDALGIPTLGTMPRAGASSCTAQALESLTHSHWQYGLSQQQVLEAAHSWDSPLCDEDPQERMSQILAHLRNMS